MRAYFYLALLVFASNVLYSQDTLYKVDGSKLIAKILVVNASQVRYKLYSYPEGPTYVISKDYVIRIIYENGKMESFPIRTPDQLISQRPIDPRISDFGRNFIAIDILDLAQSALTISYEYTFKPGLSSLKVPLSIRIAKRGSYYNTIIFGTGLDYYWYPYGQGSVKFYYGPSIEYSKYESYYSTYETNSVYKFLFKAGYLFQPQKHFNISANLGMGYARFIGKESYRNYGQVAYNASLNIGYKF